MNIVVCVKRVPDTETKIRIAGDGKSIDPTGVEFVINPFDEFAVEEAIRIKEKQGGDITVLSLGPADAQTIMRKAYAMGAEKGVHLSDESGNCDTLAIAKALAAQLKEMPCDVILMGKQAVDLDDSCVGVQVANILNIPVVTRIIKLEFANGKAKVERESDAGTEILEVTLPAVFTAEKGLNEPRYPKLMDIMKAKKKPLDQKNAQLDPPKLQVVKMEYPPARAAGKIVGEGADAAPALVNLLVNEAKVI
ncbi:MAG TPA: electron transfer flavoprotein subunit beta/FixA family protein [Thermodesulfobacteriota bacterium]|nr:electron transfer flavoprotein subunit beta/FixA family protein [Deltaproteobacteria bacterium]HOC38358.1 electron transfer flavoprotein subunit beta/FixA family protein [Thermodesulfobacteriota bacterium]